MSAVTTTCGFRVQSSQADLFVESSKASFVRGSHACSTESASGGDTFSDAFVTPVLVSSYTVEVTSAIWSQGTLFETTSSDNYVEISSSEKGLWICLCTK